MSAKARQRRPKIVRLIPVLDFGGVETTFALEAERIDRDAFDFRVCTFWNAGAAARRIRDAGIKVDVLDIDPSIRNPRATAALIRYVRKVRPDIVHASIGEANFHAALARRPSGSPITIMEEQSLPDRRLHSRLVHAMLYRLVDAVVGVSTISCDYLVAREWAPRSRVHLVYNAVPQRFLSTPLPARKRTGPFRFLTVGRLVEVKNQAILVQALADVPDAELTIIGDGPLMADLRALVAELGLTDRVQLSGFRSDILEAIDECDCFLLPSLSEGFGIAAVEALARAVPVIASTAGALPEVVGPLGAEWIVPPTDRPQWAERMRAVTKLDSSILGGIGQRARAIAERFSEQRHVESIENLYKALLNKGSKSR